MKLRRMCEKPSKRTAPVQCSEVRTDVMAVVVYRTQETDHEQSFYCTKIQLRSIVNTVKFKEVQLSKETMLLRKYELLYKYIQTHFKCTFKY